MSDKIVALPSKREWKAAKVDVMRSNWPTWTRPPNAEIRYGLRALRSRSRVEAQNNDHARGFLREVKTNVVGHKGVILQSKARLRNGKPDLRARTAIEEGWRDWGEEADTTGRLGWVDVQHQAIETVARDGECLFGLIDSWDHNPYGFAVQALDPETLDTELNETLSNGNVIRLGVELDQHDRAVAYYFVQPDRQHQTYRPSAGGRAREHLRVRAADIVHCYLPEWTLQSRGIPWMATALKRMTDLNGYDESAVIAARSGASKMGFFTQSDDAVPPLRDDGTAQHGVSDQEGADGQLYSAFDPGSIGLLPPGWEFQGWDPKFPHADHGSFTKAVLRGISTGLGVSYNTLANDMEGVNYSSLRHFALVERAVWMLIQEWFIRAFHRRVYRAWLDAALIRRALVDPRGRPLDAGRVREFRRVYWQPRRWQWVDPQKEATAAEKEIAMRVRSISSVIRERGEDPEDVWREILAEREMLAEMGITPAEATAAAVSVDQEELDDE